MYQYIFCSWNTNNSILKYLIVLTKRSMVSLTLQALFVLYWEELPENTFPSLTAFFSFLHKILTFNSHMLVKQNFSKKSPLPMGLPCLVFKNLQSDILDIWCLEMLLPSTLTSKYYWIFFVKLLWWYEEIGSKERVCSELLMKSVMFLFRKIICVIYFFLLLN